MASRGNNERVHNLRILAFVSAIIVLPAALNITWTGLALLVSATDAVPLATGAVYLVLGLVAVSGASCALWTRGYGLALLAPVALVIAWAWQAVTEVHSALPATLVIIAGLAGLVLVRAASNVFRPLLSSQLPLGGRGTHRASSFAASRVASLAGAAMLTAVGVGLVVRGADLYTAYQSPDVHFVSGQVLMVSGGVVAFTGAVSFWRYMLPAGLVGAILALLCVVWDLRLLGLEATDTYGVLAISVSLPAFVLLVLSWPAYGPRELGMPIPPGVTGWGLPSLPGGGLSIIRGTPEDLESWATEPPVTPSAWSMLLGLPGGDDGVRIIEPPDEVHAPILVDYIVEEVFVIYRDGRLIGACGREPEPLKDADLMSGMLIAIQGLVQEGLRKGGELEGITFGVNNVVLVRGDHIILAAVLYGVPDMRFVEEANGLVRRIEGSYAGTIEEWDGDPALLQVTEMVMPLVAGTSHLGRDVVRQSSVSHEVNLRSVTDFHRGQVRLSVVVHNGLPDMIRDVAMEVDYAAEMLRLEGIAPPETQRRGDRIVFGDLLPGQEVTAAFLFDPLVPERSSIDGSLTYLDLRGSRRRMEMRRKYADVVCPIFFSLENVNTAALKQLVEDRLHSDDRRAFTYPEDLAPGEVLKLGKMAVGSSGIELIKEYVVDGSPFQAEVWYFGKTRVEGYPTVAKLEVQEAKKLLELYAASTVQDPVVGLQTEFYRELDRAYNARHAGEEGMQRSREGR